MLPLPRARGATCLREAASAKAGEMAQLQQTFGQAKAFLFCRVARRLRGTDMMTRKYFVCLFLFAISFNSHSHPVNAAESLTLDQAVTTALEQNPDLLAARQEL